MRSRSATEVPPNFITILAIALGFQLSFAYARLAILHRRRMARAQRHSSNRAPKRGSSVDAREVEKFSALAGEWWNANGSFAPLHKLNPLRLAFLRRVSVRHFRRDERALAPFSGLSLLDIGCGGGLLSEPLARQGFEVLGIDASRENVAAAVTHARETNVAPTYRFADAE